MTLKRDVNPVIKLIQQFLKQKGSASMADLCTEIKIDRRWMHEYIKILRTKKKIYLAEYGIRKSGAPLMMYAWGNSPDAIKLPPKRLQDTAKKTHAKNRDIINLKKRIARAKARGEKPKTIHYMTILGVI